MSSSPNELKNRNNNNVTSYSHHNNSNSPLHEVINKELDDIETMEISDNLENDKRKSISNSAPRRVSFASKTRVRLIGESTPPSKIPLPHRQQINTTSLSHAFILDQQQQDSSSNMSLLSQQSLESDLRDPHIESFLSCNDDDDDDDDDISLDPTSTDMDFTGPLPSKKELDSPLSIDTMELTTCVGGIMSSIRPNNSNNRRPSTLIPKSLLSKTITNSITTSSPLPQISDLQLLSFNAHTDEELRDEDMEMTMIFIPPQPQTPLRDSFIGDENFNNLLSSPSINHNKLHHHHHQHHLIVDSSVMDSNTEDLSIPSTPQKQLNNNINEFDYVESPTITSLLPRAQLSEFLTQTGIRFLDRLSSNLDRRETSGVPTIGLGSNWNNIAHTIGDGDGDDDSISLPSPSLMVASQLGCDAGKEFLAQAISKTCSSLIEEIKTIRKDNQTLEDRFNHSPPLSFSLFHSLKRGDSEMVQSKLKTLKSISRLCARKAWYLWRGESLHEPLNALLIRNYQTIQHHYQSLQRIDIVPLSDKEIERLYLQRKNLQSLKERLEFIRNGGLILLKEKEEELQRGRETLSLLKGESSSLLERENELRSMLRRKGEERDAGRKKLLSLTTTSSSKIANYNLQHTQTLLLPNTLAFLEELKSQLLLFNATTGWTIKNVVFNSTMSILHNRSDVCVVIDTANFDIKFNSVPQALLPFVSLLEEKMSSSWSSSLEKKSTPQEILSLVGDNLDYMTSLVEELKSLGVQQKIAKFDDEVIITISMYSPQPPSKYDIILLFSIIGGGGGEDAKSILRFSQIIHFYGLIGASGNGNLSCDRITSIIMDFLEKPLPIKKIVAHLQGLEN